MCKKLSFSFVLLKSVRLAHLFKAVFIINNYNVPATHQ